MTVGSGIAVAAIWIAVAAIAFVHPNVDILVAPLALLATVVCGLSDRS